MLFTILRRFQRNRCRVKLPQAQNQIILRGLLLLWDGETATPSAVENYSGLISLVDSSGRSVASSGVIILTGLVLKQILCIHDLLFLSFPSIRKAVMFLVPK